MGKADNEYEALNNKYEDELSAVVQFQGKIKNIIQLIDKIEEDLDLARSDRGRADRTKNEPKQNINLNENFATSKKPCVKSKMNTIKNFLLIFKSTNVISKKKESVCNQLWTHCERNLLISMLILFMKFLNLRNTIKNLNVKVIFSLKKDKS